MVQKLFDASCPYCQFSGRQSSNFQNKRFLEIYFGPDTLNRSNTIRQNLIEKAISENNPLILEGTRSHTIRLS